MINLDYIGLNFLKDEIKNEILNYKVSKIHLHDKNSFSLFFSKKELFFQISDANTILYIKKRKEENMVNLSSSFLLTLKKYLLSSILNNIELLNNDRIMKLTFHKINMFGNKEVFFLIFEIMGRHSNIFLLDEKETILNVLNNNSTIDSKRFYTINMKYIPFNNEKSEINFDKIYSSKEEMIQNISGIGSLFSNDTFNNIEKRKRMFFSYIPLIFKKDEKCDITYNNFSKYDSFEKYEFITLNDALNEYFTTFKNDIILLKKKKDIIKSINSSIKKIENTIEKIEKEIVESLRYKEYKEIGDILTSNIYKLKNNMDKIILFDFFNNKYIEIKLNINKSPSENLKIYYEKYRKHKKNLEISNERLLKLKEKYKYYLNLLNEIENENNISSLNYIFEQSLENKKIINKKDIKKREFLKYDIEGFEVFVGRNNIENDYLTFNKAKPHDIWMHIRDFPGSHVIIITNKKEVPHSVILKVAEITASRTKGNFYKIIDYTMRKNLKRSNNKGLVSFNIFKSIEIFN